MNKAVEYEGRSGLYNTTERFATLSEIVERARENLDPAVCDFLEGGSGAERTLDRNRTAFDQWQFEPRVMSGLDVPDLSTRFLGLDLALPVLTAPFGADALFHPEGHLAVASANAAEGVVSIVPEAGSHSLEAVAARYPQSARIAQLHPMGSDQNFLGMLERIERAGYDAVCVTVDCPTSGWRERNLNNRFDPSLSVISGNYSQQSGIELSDVFGQIFTRAGAVWGWDHLAELMSQYPLPWIAKGIVTEPDALAAVEAGASGVVVSTHGGRQLDGLPGALDRLPGIAEVLRGRAAVAFDSGIRSGGDVVAALCLGADVVIVGRLAAYALAADGEVGVRRMHQLLREEITATLALLGRGGIADLGPHAIRRSSERPIS
ncbi:glycolate oxidase (plasmid) [Rhodococcus erythropolis]|uniref:alpha-hydroxy acid oxidase n=1 Tax=Rhodococcus erythropolis TaxID=1833 RepID=UPI00061B8325|nr:alpha-hydroxy acid oxidase [Rhodococcus erythropolis]AKE01097.1 glycolate oxidase [Rhodococcus erythropolis]